MYNPEDEMVYEEKLDKISEYLEDLILDALLSVLRKVMERNIEFKPSNKKGVDDGIDF
jgi:hypothetical protein